MNCIERYMAMLSGMIAEVHDVYSKKAGGGSASAEPPEVTLSLPVFVFRGTDTTAHRRLFSGCFGVGALILGGRNAFLRR
jgi:hypothetical protein